MRQALKLFPVVLFLFVVCWWAVDRVRAPEPNPLPQTLVAEASEPTPNDLLSFDAGLSVDYDEQESVSASVYAQLDQARQASDLAAFSQLLVSLLESDQTAALVAIGRMDLDDWHYQVGDVLIAHFQDFPTGVTLERFELFRENYAVFNNTVVELLRNHLHETNPLEIGSYLLRPENKDQFDVTAFQVGEHFAEQDPEASVRTFLSLEDGRIRNDLLSGALLEWIVQDAAQVSEFLAPLESSPALDEPVFNLVIRSKHEAPKEVLMSWAEGITDPRMREHAIEDLNTYYDSTTANAQPARKN
ncbi:MAG: hypothetical protein AAFX93_08905 [Verrucomicrobiota bacterium]